MAPSPRFSPGAWIVRPATPTPPRGASRPPRQPAGRWPDPGVCLRRGGPQPGWPTVARTVPIPVWTDETPRSAQAGARPRRAATTVSRRHRRPVPYSRSPTRRAGQSRPPVRSARERSVERPPQCRVPAWWNRPHLRSRPRGPGRLPCPAGRARRRSGRMTCRSRRTTCRTGGMTCRTRPTTCRSGSDRGCPSPLVYRPRPPVPSRRRRPRHPALRQPDERRESRIPSPRHRPAAAGLSLVRPEPGHRSPRASRA